MNMTVTNNDLGNVVIEPGDYRDDLLTFAGIDTFVAGTILARKAVADAVTASAVTGTGNGTVTLATVVPGSVIPLAGIYTLTCTAVVTNGGVFKLTDPNGAIVASGLSLTVGAGAVTVIETAGLQFSVTDGTTDFIIGDFFTLTVAAVNKLVPFATDGAGGAQIPKAILTYDVTSTGAGDLKIRDMISGRLNGNRLVIDADGDNSNVTADILDQLRDYSLVTIDVQDLSILDNQ